MVGEAGVCELNITDDIINISFISTQKQLIEDKFMIIKDN